MGKKFYIMAERSKPGDYGFRDCLRQFIGLTWSFRLTLSLFVAFAYSVFGQAIVPLTEKDLIRGESNPKSGFNYPYLLYVPPQIKTPNKRQETHTILVIPNNTAKIEDDFKVHETDVIKNMLRIGAQATALDVAVLMPVFPRPKRDWKIYTHALDRDSLVTEKKEYQRFDLQMLAMIDDARKRLAKEGLKFDKRVLIYGFSAQGMFANRFTFLHPDSVKAAAIGSPGGWPIAPVEKYRDKALRYPIGIADFKAVVGKDFDLKTLRKVPLFLFVGDKDENDSVPFGDSYDDEDRDIINPLFGNKPLDRWPVSETLYSQAGLNAVFRIYAGVAHMVTPQIREDVRSFLKSHK